MPMYQVACNDPHALAVTQGLNLGGEHNAVPAARVLPSSSEVAMYFIFDNSPINDDGLRGTSPNKSDS